MSSMSSGANGEMARGVRRATSFLKALINCDSFASSLLVPLLLLTTTFTIFLHSPPLSLSSGLARLQSTFTFFQFLYGLVPFFDDLLLDGGTRSGSHIPSHLPPHTLCISSRRYGRLSRGRVRREGETLREGVVGQASLIQPACVSFPATPTFTPWLAVCLLPLPTTSPCLSCRPMAPAQQQL